MNSTLTSSPIPLSPTINLIVTRKGALFMVSLIHASMMLTFSSSRNHSGPKSHSMVLKDQWVTEHGPQSYPLQYKV